MTRSHESVPQHPLSDEIRAKPRLLYIDNLRILLTSLVILHHLAITYGAPGDWYYTEVDTGQLGVLTLIPLAFFVSSNQAYFMGFFFFISGFVTPGSFDRKGPRAFSKGRLTRLGIPLLVYILVISPLLSFLLACTIRGFEHGLIPYLRGYWQHYSGLGVGPLWFVEALLIFNLIYALTARPRSKSDPPVTDSPRFPKTRWILGVALAVGLVSFAIRIRLPVGWSFAPLALQFPFFPQYIALFFLGIVASRQGWLTAMPRQAGARWCWAWLALVLVWPVMFAAGGAMEGDFSPFMGGWCWQSLVYSLWEQLFCVAVVITLLSWFKNRFNRQNRLGRWLSAGAYTAFIIHAPVLVVLALALRGVQLHLLLKLALAAPLALTASYGLGLVIKRLPGARGIL